MTMRSAQYKRKRDDMVKAEKRAD